MKRLVPVLTALAVCLGSAAKTSALPTCKGSPLLVSSKLDFAHWNDCQGTFIVSQRVSGFAGDKYVGAFRSGSAHGKGTYTHANGDKYVGDYRYGNRNGEGTYTSVTGGKYVGQFRNGKRHGKGTYTHANGDKYVGEFKDGKRHGRGTFFHLANNNRKGRKYVGRYKDGKPHGRGTVTYADGRVLEGVWKYGKFQSAQQTTSHGRSEPKIPLRKSKTNKMGSSSDASICSVALQHTTPKWGNDRNHVAEAERRGLSEAQCARASGRFTEAQIAAVHGSTTPNIVSSTKVLTWNSKRLCTWAIQNETPVWETSPRFASFNPYKRYINEAKRRGLTEAQCAGLSGRFTEAQIAAVHGSSGEKIASAKAKRKLELTGVKNTKRILINQKELDQLRRNMARLEQKTEDQSKELGQKIVRLEQKTQDQNKELGQKISSLGLLVSKNGNLITDQQSVANGKTIDSFRREVVELKLVSDEVRAELNQLVSSVSDLKAEKTNAIRQSDTNKSPMQTSFAIWILAFLGIALLATTVTFLVASIRNQKRTEAIAYELNQWRQNIRTASDTN